MCVNISHFKVARWTILATQAGKIALFSLLDIACYICQRTHKENGIFYSTYKYWFIELVWPKWLVIGLEFFYMFMDLDSAILIAQAWSATHIECQVFCFFFI